MQCPLCIETVLDPRFHGGVEIDVCPKCKGVWLDRGELDKLASAAAPASPPPMERRDDSWDRDDFDDDDHRDRSKKSKKSKKKKKRKKSFGERLGDVFEEVLDFD